MKGKLILALVMFVAGACAGGYMAMERSLEYLNRAHMTERYLRLTGDYLALRKFSEGDAKTVRQMVDEAVDANVVLVNAAMAGEAFYTMGDLVMGKVEFAPEATAVEKLFVAIARLRLEKPAGTSRATGDYELDGRMSVNRGRAQQILRRSLEAAE